jgi:NAD(P)-dependent dehydrogenase (short-subunit alcohol dehydrogenase family)
VLLAAFFSGRDSELRLEIICLCYIGVANWLIAMATGKFEDVLMGSEAKPNGKRVALVTGGARGLGRAIGEAFAQDGIALFLVDIFSEMLAETQSELRALGIDCEIFTADIAERAQCLAAVDAAIEKFGRLDILCNAAGIVRFNHATDVPEAEWSRIMAVNAGGTFWFCQAAIPHLLKTKGNIVNITSQSAQMGAAYIVPYAASKGAVLQLTRSLAMEYMDEPIRINAVSPGAMSTGILEGTVIPPDVDWKKIERYSGARPRSEAAEVAALVAFVASPRASSVHGANLTADNGVTAG